MKRQLRMGGGIMDVVPRDRALLGGIKKAVKKVTKGVKDIASSDIGKAALIGAAAFGIPGTSIGGIFGFGGISNALAAGKTALGFDEVVKKEAAKKIGLKETLGIMAGGSLLGTLAAGVEAGDEEAIEATRNVDALKTYLRQGYRNLKSFVKEDGTEDAEALEAQVNRDVSEYTSGQGGYAEGGRIKYAMGMGDSASDNAMQAAGVEGLPIRQNPKGIKELDLRETGGFIPPVGIKEKEDDIPAMLSNNEFVFTADAVRGMGEGDVNKGAERMYSMMKTLERGGRA